MKQNITMYSQEQVSQVKQMQGHAGQPVTWNYNNLLIHSGVQNIYLVYICTGKQRSDNSMQK